jgi:hypothetical protein
MGFVSGQQLSPGGAYLLGILRAEGAVPFSRFYNTETDYAALAAAAGIGEPDEEHAHVLIEFAAGQLEHAGLVSFANLPDELIDGERDYRIELTEKGKRFVEAGRAFRFRDMDL